MLAIETSQREGSVAISQLDSSVHCESLHQTKRHDDDLMPAIDRLTRRCGLTPADLDAVAVSIGPGGFTGLRISISTAKMLAETRGVQLVAVPTAQAVAESLNREGPILVGLAGKSESFWATRLSRDSNGWIIQTAGLIAQPADLDLSGVRAVVADKFLPDWARNLCEQEGVEIAEPVFSAGGCLAAGVRLLAAGQTISSLELLPLYPRPPEAVRLWKARRQPAG